MENEHRAKNRGASGAVALLKRVDLPLHARQQVELHNNKLTDFTACDWALRGIQCGEVRLDDTWAQAPTGKIDVTKVAAVQDLTWNGAGATQRRLFEVAAGRFDSAGRPWRNYYFDPVELEVVDPTLVSGEMLNHRCDNMTMAECAELWN